MRGTLVKKVLAFCTVIAILVGLLQTTTVAWADPNPPNVTQMAWNALLQATEQATGLSEQALNESLAEGKSLADIITGVGDNVSNVEATAKASVKAQLDAAVKAGTLKQAQEDRIMSGLDKMLDMLVNRHLPVRPKPPVKLDVEAMAWQALRQATEQATGLSESGLNDALASGKSLADIIGTVGDNPATVEAAAKAMLKAELQQDVAAGKITQQQADQIIDSIDSVLDKLMNRHTTPPQPDNVPLSTWGWQALVQATQQQTHISDNALDDGLADGKSLADIITGAGGSVPAVQAAAKTTVLAQLQAWVSSGKITQAQADAEAKRIDGVLTDLLNRHGQPHPRIHVTAIAWQALRDATEHATGLTDEKLDEALSDGKSLAEIITGLGDNVSTVEADAKGRVKTALDQLVAQHKITQDQENQAMATIDTTLDALVNRHLPVHPHDIHVTAIAWQALLEAVHNLTGISDNALDDALSDGKSLDDVLNGLGDKIATAEANAKASVKNTLERYVANAQLTQDQAAQIMANIDSTLDGLMSRHLDPHPHVHLTEMAWRALVNTTENVTGLSDQGLHDALSDGKSLADLLNGLGDNVSNVEATARDKVKDQLDQMVASGQLTRQQEDALLDGLDALLDRLLQRERVADQVVAAN